MELILSVWLLCVGIITSILIAFLIHTISVKLCKDNNIEERPGDTHMTVKEGECNFCMNHFKGDTLYESSDWDGGIGFDYIRDIKYCPICGKELQDD